MRNLWVRVPQSRKGTLRTMSVIEERIVEIEKDDFEHALHTPLHSCGRTILRDHTLRAFRLARIADTPTVQDEYMRGQRPLRRLCESHQVALDLDRIVFFRKTQSSRQPSDMCIDGNSFGLSE